MIGGFITEWQANYFFAAERVSVKLGFPLIEVTSDNKTVKSLSNYVNGQLIRTVSLNFSS